MNLSSFSIKSALIGLTLLVGTTVISADASNSAPSAKPQESNSKVVGNKRILLTQATTDLSGTWFCNDEEDPYYVRQVDSELWWVHESFDDGLSFVHSFNGTVLNGQINGKWADVPKGNARNYGYFTGQVVSSNQMNLNITYVNLGSSFPYSCTRANQSFVN